VKVSGEGVGAGRGVGEFPAVLAARTQILFGKPLSFERGVTHGAPRGVITGRRSHAGLVTSVAISGTRWIAGHHRQFQDAQLLSHNASMLKESVVIRGSATLRRLQSTSLL
jgi:hypothetical protein